MVKVVWTFLIGKELILEAEDGNEHDSNAVEVINDGFIVGWYGHVLF